MPNKDGTGPMGKGPGLGAGRGKSAGSRCGQGSGMLGRNNRRCGRDSGTQESGGNSPAPPASGKTTD